MSAAGEPAPSADGGGGAGGKGHRGRVGAGGKRGGRTSQPGDESKGTAAFWLKQDRQARRQITQLTAAAVETLAIIQQRPEAVHVGGLFADLRPPLIFIISNPDKFHLRPQQPAKRKSSSSSSSSSSIPAGAADSADGLSHPALPVLTADFVEAVHKHNIIKHDPVLLIYGVERRKKMHCPFAAGGEFRMQVRLTLTVYARRGRDRAAQPWGRLRRMQRAAGRVVDSMPVPARRH
jgi:hypothetical protein